MILSSDNCRKDKTLEFYGMQCMELKVSLLSEWVENLMQPWVWGLRSIQDASPAAFRMLRLQHPACLDAAFRMLGICREDHQSEAIIGYRHHGHSHPSRWTKSKVFLLSYKQFWCCHSEVSSSHRRLGILVWHDCTGILCIRFLRWCLSEAIVPWLLL
jgi:hypothetical protein